MNASGGPRFRAPQLDFVQVCSKAFQLNREVFDSEKNTKNSRDDPQRRARRGHLSGPAPEGEGWEQRVSCTFQICLFVLLSAVIIK